MRSNVMTWFVAELVVRFAVAGDTRRVIHRNLVLVRARNGEEAFRKASHLGLAQNRSYSNPAGKRVTAKFLGIADLDEVFEPLEDGAEISFRYEVTKDPHEVRRSIPRKSGLRALRPPECAKNSPDISSAEVVQRAETLTGAKRPSPSRPVTPRRRKPRT